MGDAYGRTPPREEVGQMDAPELFPGEHEVSEEAARAGWSPSIGNGWAAVFACTARVRS
jgi:hypothetical protein